MPNKELIAALETADEPSSGLDAAIFLWRLAPKWDKPLSPDEQMQWARSAHKPNYTASIDAALMLVPEGCWQEIKGPRIYLNIPTSAPNYWSALISNWEDDVSVLGWGATPALAICIAALKAGGEV